jgi:predicted transport protein
LTVKILIIVLASVALLTATIAFVVELVSIFRKNNMIIKVQSKSDSAGETAVASTTYNTTVYNNVIAQPIVSDVTEDESVDETAPVEVESDTQAKVVNFNDNTVGDNYVEVVTGQTVEVINVDTAEEEIHPAFVAPAPAGEHFVVGGRVVYVRYIYSFFARLSQSDDVLKNRYIIIKNELMSYGMKPSMAWGAESFRYGRKTLAKMTIRGKTLNLFLALNTDDYKDTKYIYEDVGDMTKYKNVPMRNKIRSDRAVKWAKELIADLAKIYGMNFVSNKMDTFVPDYQDTDTLVEMGKVRVMTTGNGDEQEVTAADFEALRKERFHRITGVDMVDKVTVDEADTCISDEAVKELVVEEHVTVKRTNGKKKKSVGIINVDTLSKNFDTGDDVTLEILISKGLLPKSTTSYKLLARGEIDKRLNVVCNDYSMQAVKMILMTGGNLTVEKE